MTKTGRLSALAGRIGFDALSAELRIVVNCCRPLASSGRVDAIQAAAAAPFDPARLLSVATAHRVEGFVEQGLAAAGVALPGEVEEVLVRRAQNGRKRMLFQAAETARLSSRFQAAGIDARFMKGATLAMLAHGSYAQKTSCDVDVLVGDDQLDDLTRLLPEWGYSFASLPGVTDENAIRRYTSINKETCWRAKDGNIQLDLHHRLTYHGVTIPTIGMRSPQQAVALSSGVSVSTIARDELVAYLLVHGMGHGWERIKWLGDLAALLGDDPAEIERLYHVAVDLRAGRCAAVGFILAAELMGTPVPAPLLATLASDPVTRYLAKWSLRMMERVELLRTNPKRTLVDMALLHLAPYLYMSGWRNRASVFWSDISRPVSSTQVRVPTPMLPFFNLIWIPLRVATRPFRVRAGK